MTEKQDSYIQIVLIDFGKATPVANNRKYNLSSAEKSEYKRWHPHISPEVIDGITTCTKSSDMYSVGRIMQQLIGNQSFENLKADHHCAVNTIMTDSLSPDFTKRLTPKQALMSLQSIPE